MPEPFEVIAVDEDEHRRTELRRYPTVWAMVRLRRHVDGGWYERERIECAPATGGSDA